METTLPTRRLYTDDEKRRAVELARKINPQYAAQFLGVNVKTLYSWLNPPRREKQTPQPASRLETQDAPVEDRPAADNGDALKRSIDTLAANVDALTAAISYLTAELSKPRNCLFNLGGEK